MTKLNADEVSKEAALTLAARVLEMEANLHADTEECVSVEVPADVWRAMVALSNEVRQLEGGR